MAGVDELKPTRREIPLEVRKLDRSEFDKWCELAGRLEFDEGVDGQAADRKALFAVYDDRWRKDK